MRVRLKISTIASADVSDGGLDYGAGYDYEDYGTPYLDILAEVTGRK